MSVAKVLRQLARAILMVLVTIVVGIKDKSSQIHVMAHRGIEWVKLHLV